MRTGTSGAWPCLDVLPGQVGQPIDVWSAADGGAHHPRREPSWAGFRAPQAQRTPASMRSARWPGTDDGFAATRLPLEHRVVPVGSRGGFRYTWAATPECCVVGRAPSAAQHRDSKGLTTPPRRSQAGVWQPFNVTASDRGAAAATTAPTSPPATDGAGMGGGGSRRPRNSAAPRRVRRPVSTITEVVDAGGDESLSALALPGDEEAQQCLHLILSRSLVS